MVFFFFCSLLQAQLEIVKEALGMLDRRVKRVSCIVHVSFANYAYFQVGGQQGRKVVQLDPQSHCCGDATCLHVPSRSR